MNNKIKMLLTIIILSATFMLGRYSVQPTENKVSEDKKIEDITINKKKTTVKTKDAKGNEQIVITEETVKDKKTVSESKTTVNTPKYRLGALVGYEFSTNKVVKGVEFSTKVLGPFDLGVYGMDNKTFGLTLGVTF